MIRAIYEKHYSVLHCFVCYCTKTYHHVIFTAHIVRPTNRNNALFHYIQYMHEFEALHNFSLTKNENKPSATIQESNLLLASFLSCCSLSEKFTGLNVCTSCSFPAPKYFSNSESNVALSSSSSLIFNLQSSISFVFSTNISSSFFNSLLY